MKRLALGLVLTCACTVPSLSSLGELDCAPDGGCVDGYVCRAGKCGLVMGGACNEGQTRRCGVDAGTCTAGVQRCVDGMWAAECEGEVKPVAETCDGLDNDCNGRVDEPLALLACALQRGVCVGSAERCVNGATVPCGAAVYDAGFEPVEASCDGVDNDCDGEVDEGVGGGVCGTMGVCAGQQRACVGGAPAVCMAPGFEAVERSCDGRDNDCNGSVDRLVDGGLLRGTTRCALTQGVCSGAFVSCVDGGFEAACSATAYGPFFEPVEQTCDGRDNDCDGVVDRFADGGVLRTGACELTDGVCATSAGRACVNGNGEAVCTATSYGPQYNAVEFTCDGLDNDCDGRRDWSKETPLVTSANALTSHLSLADFPGGLGGVFVDERGGRERVFFRLFDDALAPTGLEVELSAAGLEKAIRPNVARLGADFVATWMEEFPDAGQRVAVSRITTAGSRAWTQYATLITTSVYREPRLATRASPESVLVTWIEAPSLQLRATVFDGAGNRTVAVTALDGGAGSNVFDVDVARRPMTNDWVVSWVSLSTGQFAVRSRRYTGTLAPTADGVEFAASNGEQADKLRVAPFGATGEVAAAWVTNSGSASSTVRSSTNVLAGGAPQSLSTFAGAIADLAVQTLPQGAVAFWSQGIPQPQLVGRPLTGGDGGLINLTPAGVTGLFAPTIAPRDGGLVVVGYECDRGQGLDVYGQALCL
jgi:hypothetical protein